MNKKVMIMFLIIAVGQMFSSISLMLKMWAHRHENNHNSVIVESHNQK